MTFILEWNGGSSVKLQSCIGEKCNKFSLSLFLVHLFMEFGVIKCFVDYKKKTSENVIPAPTSLEFKSDAGVSPLFHLLLQ
jgi:hypothetical protein